MALRGVVKATMIKKTIRINIPHGLHMRVAGKICDISRKNGSKIFLECANCENSRADGCSVIQMMLLEAVKGSTIKLTIEGGDEKKTLRKIEEVFSDGAGI